MSGVEAIEQIMSVAPGPDPRALRHTSSAARETALAALAAGALDALPKNELDLADPDGAAAQALRQRVKVLSGVRVIRHPRARLSSAGAPAAWARTASVIGICASTGGPQALAALLADIPRRSRSRSSSCSTSPPASSTGFAQLARHRGAAAGAARRARGAGPQPGSGSPGGGAPGARRPSGASRSTPSRHGPAPPVGRRAAAEPR